MLAILLAEWKESILKARWSFWISVIAFVATCGIVSVSIDTFMDARKMEETFMFAYGDMDMEVYRITLSGGAEAYDRIFYGDDYAWQRKKAFEQLKANDLFKYQYSVVNPIFFFMGDFDLPRYGESMLERDDGDVISLKAVYVDNHFLKQPNVRLAKGEGFSETDFFVDRKDGILLPALLGTAYLGFYEIGDVIEGAYLGVDPGVSLRVIGFLEGGSYFFINNATKVLLDDYMVVPAVETTYNPIGEDGELYPFFRAAYDSFKFINALLVFPQEDAEVALKEARKILNDNGLFELELYSETAESMRVLQFLKGQTQTHLVIALSVLLLTACMFTIQVHFKILRNKKKYSTFVLSGMGRRQLTLVIGSELFGVFLLSNVLFLFISHGLRTMERGEGLTWYTALIMCILQLSLLGIMGFIGQKLVFRLNMSSVLRQHE